MAITLNDIKKMPPQNKALAIIVIMVLIGLLYYTYFFSGIQQKKSDFNNKLNTLQTQIKEKEKVVLELDKYIADVAALKETYKVALEKLPDQREIPGLFHSVALSGKDAGIEFLLFEPKAAVPKTMAEKPGETQKPSDLLKPSTERQVQPQKATGEAKPAAGKKPPAPQLQPFYEEIPVKVSVIGNFRNIVFFFEKIAKLPRIVNISDIIMGDRKDVKGRGYVITASCTIKTYMFVDKKEKIDGPKK
jgi:type IV pilus assembly protein PilO